MDEYAVIVAGGSGKRLKSKLPKQFIEIGGLPILMHTINKFKSYSSTLQIILVVPDSQIDTWNNLCQKYQFNTQNLTLVKGGETRYQSCKNGIESIGQSNALVAIHDGVRPFVTEEIIKSGFEHAKKHGTAVCCVESKDSARYLEDDGLVNKALDRKKIRLIQTPQVFQLSILRHSYSGNELNIFTDDASVVEYAGYPIYLYDGDIQNIKITTREDLLWAEVFIKSAKY